MDLVSVKLALDDIYLMLNSVNEYVDKVIVSLGFLMEFFLFFFVLLNKILN